MPRGEQRRVVEKQDATACQLARGVNGKSRSGQGRNAPVADCHLRTELQLSHVGLDPGNIHQREDGPSQLRRIARPVGHLVQHLAQEVRGLCEARKPAEAEADGGSERERVPGTRCLLDEGFSNMAKSRPEATHSRVPFLIINGQVAG